MIESYLEEQVDDRWYVGIPPDDFYEFRLRCWCEEVIGDEDVDWGVEADEFYSPLSSGTMFWFTSEESFFMFRLRLTK